jgi:hypothetical protein
VLKKISPVEEHLLRILFTVSDDEGLVAALVSYRCKIEVVKGLSKELIWFLKSTLITRGLTRGFC